MLKYELYSALLYAGAGDSGSYYIILLYLVILHERWRYEETFALIKFTQNPPKWSFSQLN